MAWALKLDGVNDKLSAPIWVPTDLDNWEVAIETKRLSVDGYAALLNISDHLSGIYIIAISGTTRDDVVVYVGGKTATLRGSGFNKDQKYHCVVAKCVSGQICIGVDGVFSASVTRGDLSFKYPNLYIGGTVSGGYLPEVDLKSMILVDSVNSSFSRNYSATDSDHSNTGAQPRLVNTSDVTGATDAVGVGMPTDGSAWVNLGGGSELVTIDNSSQVQLLSQVTLTQNSVISIGSLSQLQSLDNVSFSQNSTVSVNNLEQIQSLSQVNLTQAHVVSIDNVTQAQSLELVSLLVGGVVAINNAAQIQSLDNVNLSANSSLTVNNLSQSQSVEQIVLSTLNGSTIIIDNTVQSQSLDSIDLSKLNVIAVDSMSQSQILQAINFNGIVVGYLQGALTIISAYNGQIKLTNPLSGEIRIL